MIKILLKPIENAIKNFHEYYFILFDKILYFVEDEPINAFTF